MPSNSKGRMLLNEKTFKDLGSGFMEIAGWEVFFCRCPHCPKMFQKKPDYYVKRLQSES